MERRLDGFAGKVRETWAKCPRLTISAIRHDETKSAPRRQKRFRVNPQTGYNDASAFSKLEEENDAT
jgi:hypothetical protein